MVKIAFNISPDGYQIDESTASSSAVPLRGGSGRYRADLVGTSDLVTITWVLEGSELDQLLAIYDDDLDGGRLEFLIDLIVDEPFPVERTAKIVPGSLSLVQTQGFVNRVQATLEVLSATPPYAGVIGHAFQEGEGDPSAFFNILEQLVNVWLPPDLGIRP